MQYIISTLLLAGLVIGVPEAPLYSGPAAYPPAENTAASYPPSGWKPSGRLLVLPAKQVAQYGAPSDFSSSSTEAEKNATEYPVTTPQYDDGNNPAAYTDGFPFEKLQQKPGSEHGIYHVLLPDGRLQRVEYVTAPLKSNEKSTESAPAQQSSNYEKGQYTEESEYQQKQDGNFQQDQFSQTQYTQQTQYEENPQYQYNQPQSGKIQSTKFEQLIYPQPGTPFFPGSFPQPLNQQQESAKLQQGQFNSPSLNFQSSQNQQAQNFNYQQSQSNPSNFYTGFQQSQNGKITKPKNQVQAQHPQQPEYETNSSQTQFNQKKSNKPTATNGVTSETSSRFTNAQQQHPTQEYTPYYYAQQQNTQPAVPGFNGFVANVQYKDVEPIATPVYTYNPAPLVRILRRI